MHTYTHRYLDRSYQTKLGYHDIDSSQNGVPQIPVLYPAGDPPDSAQKNCTHAHAYVLVLALSGYIMFSLSLYIYMYIYVSI